MLTDVLGYPQLLQWSEIGLVDSAHWLVNLMWMMIMYV
jgi:hypothetical protein